MLLHFTQASHGDADTVLAILDEAAEWLQHNGIKQWPARFSGPDDWRSTRITSYLDAGQTWLVETAGTAIGTVTLAGPDPDYVHGWPSAPEDGLYVYRMAVRRAYAGIGIGARMLDWASARAAATGKTWLRFDCHRHNPALQRYYEQQGFERVGTIVATIDPGAQPTGTTYTRGSGALYQRPAGSVFISVAGDTPSPQMTALREANRKAP